MRLLPLVLAWVGVAIAAAVPAAAPQVADQQPAPPKTDAFGDPLPPGAVARIGTARLRHSQPILSLALSADGAVLASGNYDREKPATLWDARTGKLLYALEHKGGDEIRSRAGFVALSPDGQTVAVGGLGPRLHLWDVRSGQERTPINVQGSPGRPVDGTGAVAFSPQGDVLAVETWVNQGDGRSVTPRMVTVRLLSAASGKPFFHLFVPDDRGHGNTSFVFSPDGRSLAMIGGKDYSVHVWETTTGKLRAKFGKNALACAFAPDGKTVAVAGLDAMHLFDVLTQEEVRTLRDFPAVEKTGPGPIAFSPDGKYLVAGGGYGDPLVHVWDTATWQQCRQIATEPAQALVFGGDGKTLITASGSMIRVWDVTTGKQTVLPDVPRLPLTCAEFAPDGKTLAVAGGADGVRLFETASYKETRHFGDEWVRGLAFSADGRHLATAGEKPCWWDAATGKKVRTFEGHAGAVTSVALLPDGRTLMTGSYDGTMRLWDIAGGNETAKYEHPQGGGKPGLLTVQAVAVVPRSKQVATVAGQSVWLWDTGTNKLLRKFTGESWQGPVGALAVSADGRLLAHESPSSVPPSVLLEALDAEQPPRSLGDENSPELHWGLSFAFSPDGKLLATGSADTSVRLWDVAKGKELCRFRGHIDRVVTVSFSPDGRRLASASWDGTVLVWDVEGVR